MQQIVVIKNKKFLIHSVLKLSTTVNILGFWEVSEGKWSAHVQSVTLSHQEWDNLNVK